VSASTGRRSGRGPEDRDRRHHDRAPAHRGRHQAPSRAPAASTRAGVRGVGSARHGAPDPAWARHRARIQWLEPDEEVRLLDVRSIPATEFWDYWW